MFYYLHQFTDAFSFLNLFRYITFRSACASITAFAFSIIVGPRIIAWLKQVKVTSFNQREHAQQIHQFYAHKNTVPTVGGILIVASLTVAIGLWGNLSNRYLLVAVFATLGYGFVGFLDDWFKLKSKSSKGLSSRQKMLGQVAISIIVGGILYADPTFDKWLYMPLMKKGFIYLGILFIPFVVLVMTGSSNALNLTDGLDGLAIGCTLFSSAAFGIIAYLVGRADFSGYLHIPHVPESGELTVFMAALLGASAGFLWFNSYPAEVMMGDTGSLALGGALGTVAVLLKKEVVLAIVGGVFVWEALSVMIQVTSFKLTKKRVFLMSPFHHHLQLKGWPESKVTIRLWIIAMILAVIGLSTLKVR